MKNATKTLEDYYVAPPGICIDMNITIHTNVQLYIFILMKIDYIIDKSIPDNLKHNDELRVVNNEDIKNLKFTCLFPPTGNIPLKQKERDYGNKTQCLLKLFLFKRNDNKKKSAINFYCFFLCNSCAINPASSLHKTNLFVPGTG